MTFPALVIFGLLLVTAGPTSLAADLRSALVEIPHPKSAMPLGSTLGNTPESNPGTNPGTPADSEAAHVQAELLADQDALVPGATVRVGVRHKIAPHWHIYWRHPGDAGLATHIDWKLPPGFTAGELHWAVPQRFEDAGPIVTFGYTDELLLWSEVKVPADAAVGATLTLQARTQWLACRTTCVPGEASVQLTLPVRAQAQPANQELFAAWMQRLPAPLAQAQPPVTVQTEGNLPAGPARGTLRVILQWSQPVRTVEIFPAPDATLLVENLRVVHKDAQTAASLEIERLQSPEKAVTKPTTRLPVVVAYVDAQGTRRGLSVDLPLTPTTNPQPASNLTR